MKRIILVVLLLGLVAVAEEDPFYKEIKLGEVFPIVLSIPELPDGAQISRGEWTFAFRDADFKIAGSVVPSPNLVYRVPKGLREGWNGLTVVWKNPEFITDEELGDVEREDLYPFTEESFSVLALRAMRVSEEPIEIPAPQVILFDQDDEQYLVNVKSTKVVVAEKPVIEMQLDLADDSENTLP